MGEDYFQLYDAYWERRNSHLLKREACLIRVNSIPSTQCRNNLHSQKHFQWKDVKKIETYGWIRNRIGVI